MSDDERSKPAEKSELEPPRYVRELLAENERLRRHLENLEERLGALTVETRHASEQYVKLERRSSHLAALYVASQRLTSSTGTDEVVSAIQDIVANLMGSEEMAIFDVGANPRELTLRASLGVDPEQVQKLAAGDGPIGSCAASGEPYLRREDSAGDDDLTACVPLRLDGKVTGVIAIFRLLPQKTGIERVDRELLDLLANQAGTALHYGNLSTPR
jgi:K+-sensing histidine kinase KdpD